MMRSMRHSNGFTLIEIIVTLVIATLLATATIPGFNDLIKKTRISTYTSNLVASLALARSEAVKRGTRTSLCASNNGLNCTHTSFQQGWIVFTDQNTAGTVDGTDTVLRIQKAATSLRFTITGNAIVQYLPSGVLVSSTPLNDYERPSETTPAPLNQGNPLKQLLASLMPGTVAHASNHIMGSTRNQKAVPSSQSVTPATQALTATPSDPLRTGITNFDICSSDASGESGILVVVSITGRISTLDISCS